MKFYYELVDDLLGREEFAKLVESKINDSGGILEDHVAAMLVLKDLGRAHQKVARLDKGASFVLFFGKIIEKSGPRVFKKEGGDSGFVSEIIVGDETGNARLLLWGDMARGVEEVDQGDVVEVLARFKSKDREFPQLSVIALKESSSEIRCLNPAPSGDTAPALHNITVKLVAVRYKKFMRKDGSDAEYIDVLAGNESGVFRLLCWTPELIEGIQAGDNVVVENAILKSKRGVEEYQIDENTVISKIDRQVEIAFTGTNEVSAGGHYSVRGRVTKVLPPRNFTRQNGEESWVRTITISDESGELPVVMWGDLAVLHIVRKDFVTLYNAIAKNGRSGGVELNTTGSSTVEVRNDEPASGVSIKGTVVRSSIGYTIDNGAECYVLSTPLKNGSEVLIEGQLSRKIITPEKCSGCSIIKKSVLMRIDNFIDSLSVKQ